jgi:2,4-dienoyl-CoA reductase-like NADH-dependent reductase (Old Yellow Enzyme family)
VSSTLPACLTPFTIRGVGFRNRIVVSPMCQYSSADGYAGDWHRAHHARLALSGVGGAVVEATAVTADGRITPGCLGIWQDAHIEPLRRLTDIWHAAGAPVGIQLAHSGRKGSAAPPHEGAAPLANGPRAAEAWPTLAPSAIAQDRGWPVPQAMSEQQIGATLDAFGAAAERAVAANFDFVEIHAAHGYLIHSFLSPLSNQRDDAWGGDAARRMRFALEVARTVRRRVPTGMPVFARLSCIDADEGVSGLEETLQVVRALQAAGVDLIDCSAGGIAGPSGRAPVPLGPAYLVPTARRIQRETGVPTMATGLIDTPQLAESAIASGEVSLLAIGRQLLVEPSFAYRAAVELGHPSPEDLLPAQYAFFIRRKRAR